MNCSLKRLNNGLFIDRFSYFVLLFIYSDFYKSLTQCFMYLLTLHFRIMVKSVDTVVYFLVRPSVAHEITISIVIIHFWKSNMVPFDSVYFKILEIVLVYF